jgi:conjugative transfer pilus assembly protein TraH
MKSIKRIFIFCNFFIALEANASMENELDNFFKNFGGGGVNYSKGGVYNDQTGGYYTGGRLYARTPAKSINIANIQAPSFQAGCGGIDTFLGGMSFINAKEFINASRTIMSNALGYAASLSLQTMAPQVYNTMHKLNDIARDINNMNITSCEAAATLMAGAWPKSDASSRYLCNVMGTSNNVFEDWAQSRQSCGAEGKRDSVNRGKGGDFKDILGDEFNLVWKAIRKNSFLSSDNELAEIFMSISGSIISKKIGTGKDAKFHPSHLTSLANDQELIDALLYGGITSAAIYGCDDYNEDKCLNPTKKKFKLPDKKGLVNRVEDLLQSIANKSRTYDDTGLTEQEKGLIESTRIPS